MIEQELRRHGYLFEFVGMWIEENATLLTSAFLARRGYFDLLFVILVAFAGTALMNQVIFEVGKRKGPGWLRSAPKAAARMAIVGFWIERYGAASVFASRFVIGFRSLVPFACGALGMQRPRFLIGNISGALAWAIVFGAAGYAGGHILTILLTDVRKHEILIAAAIAISTLAFVFLRRRIVIGRIPRAAQSGIGV